MSRRGAVRGGSDGSASGGFGPGAVTAGGMNEPQGPTSVEHLSRPQAIERLRSNLRLLADEEHCVCAAAARIGVLCRGFQNLSDAELRRRFDWIARPRPGVSRAELEGLVSLYHRGRQDVTGAAVCCDVRRKSTAAATAGTCSDNDKLEEFSLELTGRRVRDRIAEPVLR